MVADPLYDREEGSDWNDNDWDALLMMIEEGSCTPFIGAGACVPTLPTGKTVARELAAEYQYPFPDRTNLPRVAQYIEAGAFGRTPHRKIRNLFENLHPDYNDLYEPHVVAASLELPVYITTNYDNFMVEALSRDVPRRRPHRDAHNKPLRDENGAPLQEPKTVPFREVCQWYRGQERAVPKARLAAVPTARTPLVYHLHGTLEDLQSMVLTEDDYLDFLSYVSEYPRLIPEEIQDAFKNSSFLFLGYSLEDLDFKVLIRRLSKYMGSKGARHVSVQLQPQERRPTPKEIYRARKQRQFLEKQFGLQQIRVYWGDCKKFTTELARRWARRTPK